MVPVPAPVPGPGPVAPVPAPVPVPVPPVPMPVPVGMDPGSRFYRTAAAKMARRSLTRVRSALTLCEPPESIQTVTARGNCVAQRPSGLFSPAVVRARCGIRVSYKRGIFYNYIQRADYHPPAPPLPNGHTVTDLDAPPDCARLAVSH